MFPLSCAYLPRHLVVVDCKVHLQHTKLSLNCKVFRAQKAQGGTEVKNLYNKIPTKTQLSIDRLELSDCWN
jgi:hypothetical protein